MKIQAKILRSFAILALLLAVALVYYPGLRGPFVLDDHENIISNGSIAVHDLSLHALRDAMWSNDSGPLKRPLAALSFALNHHLAGGFTSSLWYKFVNLCLHLTNAVLLYFLALALMRSPVLANRLSPGEIPKVAAFATALWALHPIQLTSVLYVVQRMNSMSALFVVSGLIVFCHGRQLLEKGNGKGIPIMFGGMLIGLILGMASKENAALMPLYMLAIELTLYRRTLLDSKTRNRLRLFYSATILIPAIVFFIYLVEHPGLLHDAYLERRFSVAERVMTESRVLWFYVSLILVPDAHRLGLFHDDIPVSTALLNPPSTLFSMLGIGALLALAVIRSRQYPIAGFAILWFLFGHGLESSFFGLEIAFEHRNYLPSFGILLGISYAINRLHVVAGNLRGVIPLLMLLLALALGTFTWNRANIWSDPYTLAENAVHHHPDSPNANDMAARVNLERGELSKSIYYIQNGARVAPDEVGFRIDLHLLLAGIADNISDEVMQATQHGAGLDKIKINGLPDNIAKTLDNDVLRLYPKDYTENSIGDLLRNKAISAHGIMSLDHLHNCIVAPPHACRSAYRETLDWYTSAASNNKTSPEYHALILSNTASLHAWKKNYQRALEYIVPAIQTDPNRLYYRLLEAEYLVHLARLDEARVRMDIIGKNKSLYRLQLLSHKDMYNKLLQQLEGDTSPRPSL
ncbi:MAG: hypothetical protein NUV75_01030 [Gallionella sp.]|nr:hypothetical protein [Gallionella sp.]